MAYSLKYKTCAFLVTLLFIFASLGANSQTETQKSTTPDSTAKSTDTKKENEKGWNDEFVVYAGGSLDKMSSSDKYSSTMNLGYRLGFAYKRGKFFYWQVGARFNNASYKLSDLTLPSDSSKNLDTVFSVREIGVPITGGINLLSAVNRILALRIFVSAVPSYALGVGANDLGITTSNINRFNVYGEAGIGFNVAFFILETGVDYGFMDVLKDAESKPVQVFLHLGFRF